MKELGKLLLGVGLLLAFVLVLAGLTWKYPPLIETLRLVGETISAEIAVLLLTAVVVGSLIEGVYMLTTTNYRELGLWFRWHTFWLVNGSYCWPRSPTFPESKSERHMLAAWVKERLGHYAEQTFFRDRQKTESARILAFIEAEQVSDPYRLLGRRKRIQKARKNLEFPTLLTNASFRDYHLLCDLFRDMGMLPDGWKDPETFRQAHKPIGPEPPTPSKSAERLPEGVGSIS